MEKGTRKRERERAGERESRSGASFGMYVDEMGVRCFLFLFLQDNMMMMMKVRVFHLTNNMRVLNVI